ncbi:MAG: phosphate acyltransferase PlsX [Proteobacteria bacterium]|nr:phosphate acyltransferase PlsX [Pseudomonadota bacterium]
MRIALDAMGGDHAPEATVAGAFAAAVDGFHILLVGDEAVLDDPIKVRGGLPPNLHVHHASEVVEMDDAPRSALRRKKDSSLRVAFELLRNDQADAVVTMGNSGAALAMGMFVTGRLDGVLRPAIAALVPQPETPVVLLDAGANLDCRAEHLHQFAIMGAALSEIAFGIPAPRVGLLSNGEEDGKGTDLVRSAAELIGADPGVDFAGHIEPAELLAGAVDVVVTDGWTGNIALKTAEGILSHAVDRMRSGIESSVRGKVGAALLKPVVKAQLGHLDPRTAGGGLLLGIDACALIGHGSSDAEAVAAALRFADRLAHAQLPDRIRERLGGGLREQAAPVDG